MTTKDVPSIIAALVLAAVCAEPGVLACDVARMVAAGQVASCTARNVSFHLRRLERAGYICCTQRGYLPTVAGEARLADHLRQTEALRDAVRCAADQVEVRRRATPAEVGG